MATLLGMFCINVSVLQDSILGHTLFLMFINSLSAHQRTFSSQLGTYNDYSCLNTKSDQFYKVKLVTALKNDLHSAVNWDKK